MRKKLFKPGLVLFFSFSCCLYSQLVHAQAAIATIQQGMMHVYDWENAAINSSKSKDKRVFQTSTAATAVWSSADAFILHRDTLFFCTKIGYHAFASPYLSVRKLQDVDTLRLRLNTEAYLDSLNLTATDSAEALQNYYDAQFRNLRFQMIQQKTIEFENIQEWVQCLGSEIFADKFIFEKVISISLSSEADTLLLLVSKPRMRTIELWGGVFQDLLSSSGSKGWSHLVTYKYDSTTKSNYCIYKDEELYPETSVSSQGILPADTSLFSGHLYLFLQAGKKYLLDYRKGILYFIGDKIYKVGYLPDYQNLPAILFKEVKFVNDTDRGVLWLPGRVKWVSKNTPRPKTRRAKRKKITKYFES